MMLAANFGADALSNFALPPSVLARDTTKLIFVGNGLSIVDANSLAEDRGRFVYRDGVIREGLPKFRRLEAPAELTCHGLELLSVEGKPQKIAGSFNWNTLVRAVILHETQVLERFTRFLLAYCTNRIIGDRKLSAIASVRLRLAETSQILAIAREMSEYADTAFSPAHGREVTNLISKAIDLLIKTAGARSMLSGGLVEMQFVFTIFNNIYLCVQDEQY